MLNTDYYFPTPIWWTDTEADTDVLKQLCKEMQSADPEGRHLSNRNGWQSADITVGEYDATDTFSKFVVKSAIKCLEDYGYNTEITQLQMANMWFSVNKEGGYNQTHAHSGSAISGTYYISVPENAGEITFYRNPYEEHLIYGLAPIKNVTEVSAATCRYPPKKGRLILFPSYLLHSVMPSFSSEERISLSFNLGIKNV